MLLHMCHTNFKKTGLVQKEVDCFLYCHGPLQRLGDTANEDGKFLWSVSFSISQIVSVGSTQQDSRVEKIWVSVIYHQMATNTCINIFLNVTLKCLSLVGAIVFLFTLTFDVIFELCGSLSYSG